MEFSNQQISTDSIPSIGWINFQEVEKSYLNVRFGASIIFSLILLLVLIGFYLGPLDDARQKVKFLKYVPLPWITICCLSFLSGYMNYKRLGYAIREKDLVFKKGWIWKSQTMIPYKRIQHSEVTQNPIERFFNLSKLKVFTAGGASSDLSIPGLTPNDADRIKEFISSKTTMNDE